MWLSHLKIFSPFNGCFSLTCPPCLPFPTVSSSSLGTSKRRRRLLSLFPFLLLMLLGESLPSLPFPSHHRTPQKKRLSITYVQILQECKHRKLRKGFFYFFFWRNISTLQTVREIPLMNAHVSFRPNMRDRMLHHHLFFLLPREQRMLSTFTFPSSTIIIARDSFSLAHLV